MENLRFESLSEKNSPEVHEFCEHETKFWSVPLETFKRFMLKDTNFDPELTLIARQGEKLVGFAAAAKRKGMIGIGTRGVLKAIVIATDIRRKGYGTLLLTEIAKRLKAIKIKHIVAMCAPPDYWFSGVDVRHTPALFFLKTNKFRKRGQRINLSVDLTSPNLAESPVTRQGNYIYSRATTQDKAELIAFVQKHHGIGSWPVETAMVFENDPVTNFIARDATTRELVGWATHSCSFVGSFGPTGVLKELRGQGIGGILLRWCMHDLMTTFKQKEMIIRWVTGNTVKFYSKAVGAYISQVFWVMRRWI